MKIAKEYTTDAFTGRMVRPESFIHKKRHNNKAKRKKSRNTRKRSRTKTRRTNATTAEKGKQSKRGVT